MESTADSTFEARHKKPTAQEKDGYQVGSDKSPGTRGYEGGRGVRDRPESLASADLDRLNDQVDSPVSPQRKKSAAEREVGIGARSTSPIEGPAPEPAPVSVHGPTTTASNAITAAAASPSDAAGIREYQSTMHWRGLTRPNAALRKKGASAD
eukprot:COSAG05_NODE_9564_length_615_cov_6.393411_1_plen_152_part_01